MAIATYEDPFDLKQRRQNLSLDQGPSDVILAESKGSTKAGLMTPSGTSQDPVDIAVGPQPVFEDLNEKEKQSKWELEKIGYKAKLERLAGIVDDSEKDTSEIIGKPKIKRIKSNNSGVDTTSIVEKPDKSSGSRINLKRLTEEDRMQQNQFSNLPRKRPGQFIADTMTNQQMTEGYPGNSGGVYQQSFFGERVKGNQLKTVTDKDHETNITFEELESTYSGSPFNVIPKEEKVKAKEDYLEYKNANEKRADYLNKDVEEIQGTSSEWLIGLKNIITEGEADNYNTISNLHKNPPPTDLTNMTVAEVKVWMEQERGNDAESTASGQYQINYTNLNYLLNKGTLRPNELFNEDTQDKAYKQLLNKRKFNRYENAMKQGSEVQDPSGVKELSDKKIEAAMEMQLRLAKEWASIPIPYDLTKAQRGVPSKYPNGLKKGQSYYEEAGLNSIPASNRNVDFLNYLLSYTEIQENN